MERKACMPDQSAKSPLRPADLSSMTDCAVLVIDMWDQHWCKTMTARVQELAPKVNAFLVEARRRNALIIHAPSGARPMQSYKDHPARQRAKDAQGAPLPNFTPVPVSLPIVVNGSDPDHYGCEDTP